MLQRISLPVILLFASVLVGLSCRRSTLTPSELTGGSVLTGVVVEAPGCGLYVVKVLSGSIADSSVVPSWTDTKTDSTFTNVFTVKDWILMDQVQVPVGDTFTFTLNGPLPDSLINKTYFTCDVEFYNMPAISNNVTNIQKLH